MKAVSIVCAILFSALALAGQTNEPAAANTLAVLDFTAENLSGEGGDWTVGLADYVELALQQEGVPTLERRQIRLILGERDLQTRFPSAAEAWQMARLPAVAYFVSGNVSRIAPDRFALTISVIQAGTATVKAALTKRGAYPADWLPAIQSLARDVSAQVRTQAPSQRARSEVESLTWLPEAALPFFKGLEYYSRGDYARAIPYFRNAAGKAGQFDQARLWEARASRQIGFGALAEFAARPVLRKPVAATNSDAKLPVVAVIASEGIPAAGQGAFVQRLKQSGEFTLFDPASIAATTRETDLQLTGEMAAPLNGRSVWLAVDSVVVLSAGDGTLRARQCDVLSGEPMRQARIPIPSAPDDSAFDTLAGAFLQTQPAEKVRPPAQADVLPQELPEPDSHDTAESAFAKTVRLVNAHTNSARYWVALADCYGEWDSKMWLLDQAVNAVERDKAQPDAPFWLASALWRKRQMSSWAWLYSHAWSYSEHPLTNDFARLLEWFPNSSEARTALDEVTRKAGVATYCDPKDGHFMAAVFTNVAVASRRAPPEPAPSTASPVTAAQRLARLKVLVRQGDHAQAWRLADSLLESRDPAIHAEAQQTYDELFKQLLEEDRQIKAFNAAFEKHESEAAWKIGRLLLNNIQRKQRLALIERCGQLLKARKDVEAYFQFVFEQAEQYKEDFDLDPVTGSPVTVILDFEPVLAPDYTLQGAPVRAQRWTTSTTDMEYARLMGELAEEIQAECHPDLAARVFEAIRRNHALPIRNRLTAAYDLAAAQYQQGKVFEALELLKELLQQTEGTGLPIARKLIWTSGQVEGAAFDLLRKIRLYTDEYTDFTKCCGEPAPVPAPDPALAEEMNQFFADLWKQFKGGVGGDNQSVAEKLLGQKDRVMPVLLYKLWKGEDAQMLLAFCGQLGTNAAAAVPYLPRYVCYSDDFPQCNNALGAFGGIGKPAACATPLLILAAEGTTSVFNAEASLRRIGPAPRSVMPYLARLLDHPNPGVCNRAAKAIIASAHLEARQLSEQDMVGSLRKWWEEEGSKKEWRD